MRGGAGAFRAVLSEGGLLGAKELGQKVDPAHLSVSWSFQLTRSSLQDFLDKGTNMLDLLVKILCIFETCTFHRLFFFIVVLLQLSHIFVCCSPLPFTPAATVNPHPVVHAHGSFMYVP